jgi:hypothetical protein
MTHRFPGVAPAVAVLILIACRPAPRSIAPEDLAPVSPDSVTRWVSDFTPTTRVRYDLRWRFQNDRGSTGGRAAARIAPPDSLRFDLRGMLGKSGAAVVVGSTGVWARPESDFKDILQSAPLFWAALGVPLRPPAGTETFGVNGAERRAWRYAIASDTFDFIVLRDRPVQHLLAEMRRRGKIVGVVDAQFDSAGARVASARMDFPAQEYRFTFTVEAVDSSETFGPEIWARP